MTFIDRAELHLDADRTTLSDGNGQEVIVNIGFSDMADRAFAHDLPTPLELEMAIAEVEDALEAAGLRHASRGTLLIADPVLQDLLNLPKDGTTLGRDVVEACFERLALASERRTNSAKGFPANRSAAAAILLLRECMHHLGYETVGRANV